jgi:hypothetical protein
LLQEESDMKRFFNVNSRLVGIIAIVEAVLVTALFFLLGQHGVPTKAGIVLVWLVPMAFGLHVAEEFAFPGGYPNWHKAYSPKLAEALTPSYLLKVNAIPGALTILVALSVFDWAGGYTFFGIRAWLVFLSLLGANGLFHVRGAIMTKRYCPGMVKSAAIYLPLAVVCFAYFLSTGVVDIYSAIVCLAVGALFQPALDYLKARSLKKGTQA